jgi:geranylgeranyl pyrophosphate synthase
MELVHAYSLVHDDLPCMDDASLRRGRPCVHLLYGEAMGVLAGDGLLTLAFEVLARGTPESGPIGAMTEALARGAGWHGMVGGQVLDLAADDSEPDLDQVREIHLGKTAALIATSLRLGALVGGGDSANVERLELFGRDIGLAFQIVDDVLDESLDPVQMGKDTGADADNNKLTWPGVVGLTQAKADARHLVDESLIHAEGGQATALLVGLAEKVLSRQN